MCEMYILSLTRFLQYEILHNPQTVDLLVSLAYVSATEGAMEDPLPIGLGLRVPYPSGIAPMPSNLPGQEHTNAVTVTSGTANTTAAPLEPARIPVTDEKGLCDFDDLALNQV